MFIIGCEILDYDSAEKKINIIINKSKSYKQLFSVVDFLYENFDKYSWIGIYVVCGTDLVLGPWRGEEATEHTQIPIGKGICGSAARTGETELIQDVNKDNIKENISLDANIYI